MGRKKIPIEPIKDERNREVTFKKRKQGLIKKAMELSILCNCQISLVIFNSQNQLYEYCSADPRLILQHYCQVAHTPHERHTNADYDRFEAKAKRRPGQGGKDGNNEAGSSDQVNDDSQEAVQPTPAPSMQNMQQISMQLQQQTPQSGGFSADSSMLNNNMSMGLGAIKNEDGSMSMPRIPTSGNQLQIPNTGGIRQGQPLYNINANNNQSNNGNFGSLAGAAPQASSHDFRAMLAQSLGTHLQSQSSPAISQQQGINLNVHPNNQGNVGSTSEGNSGNNQPQNTYHQSSDQSPQAQQENISNNNNNNNENFENGSPQQSSVGEKRNFDQVNNEDSPDGPNSKKARAGLTINIPQKSDNTVLKPVENEQEIEEAKTQQKSKKEEEDSGLPSALGESWTPGVVYSPYPKNASPITPLATPTSLTNDWPASPGKQNQEKNNNNNNSNNNSNE